MLTRYRTCPTRSIEPEETEESLPPIKCRICLKEGVIPIYGEDHNISKDVMEFGAIEISCDDNLPQHLCVACHSLLESAILFRKTAKESDNILKNPFYADNSSVLSDELDNKDAVHVYDSDNEICIKKEYLELQDSQSDSEPDWKFEPKSEEESLSNFTQTSVSQSLQTNDDGDTDLQKVKKEDDGCNDNYLDNEVVMIIVSGKDKIKPHFDCEKCDVTFQCKDDLVKHDIETHSATMPDHQRKCDICHKIVDKKNYKTHIKLHREKYKEKHDKKYGKVECAVCGKKVNKSYYKYHMKMHGSAEEQAERTIQCTLCDKAISTNYFNDHMKRVHDNAKRKQLKTKPKSKKELVINQKLIECPVCDRKVEESVYKEHLAKHGGSNKTYICDKCGKSFKYPSAFKTHTLTHGSELKYQCQFCPYRGLHLALLKIHVRTHTGDYNYKCNLCPARFITKSNLSKHVQRHEGVYNYKCDICNKGFYAKRDVEKHKNTVHLDLKDNICDICGKGFGHRDNMLSHQLKVHKRVKITDKKGRLPSYLKTESKHN